MVTIPIMLRTSMHHPVALAHIPNRTNPCPDQIIPPSLHSHQVLRLTCGSALRALHTVEHPLVPSPLLIRTFSTIGIKSLTRIPQRAPRIPGLVETTLTSTLTPPPSRPQPASSPICPRDLPMEIRGPPRPKLANGAVSRPRGPISKVVATL